MAARKRMLTLAIVAMVASVSIGAAGLRWAAGADDHEARVLLYFSTDSSFRGEDRWIPSEKHLRRCAEEVTSPVVTLEVIDRLNLDETPSALATRVTVGLRDETAIFEVTVRDPSPQRAVLVADGFGSVAQELLSWPEGDACSNGDHRSLLTVTEPAALVDG